MEWDARFRLHATQARKMEEQAISDVEKEAWLRIAEGWLGLIDKQPPTADAHRKRSDECR